MTERVYSMKNGELQFIASDFEPIPFTEKIRTPSHINGRKLPREGISLLARYLNRFNFDANQIGRCSRSDIHKIHKNNSPGKEYRDRHLDENAYNRAIMKYVALFQRELRKYNGERLEGSLIKNNVTFTVPEEHHTVDVIENYQKIVDKTLLLTEEINS